MIIYSSGITIKETEQKALRHILPDPEATILASLTEKVANRKQALIEEWRPRLFADDSVTSLPATVDEIVALILARDDYQTRAEQDAADSNPTPGLGRIAKFNATDRSSGTTVTLFSSGITIADLDANSLLAYTTSINEWVIGALLGHINRGTKNIIKVWEPILLADASVTSLPATSDGWIETVTARDDYQVAS